MVVKPEHYVGTLRNYEYLVKLHKIAISYWAYCSVLFLGGLTITTAAIVGLPVGADRIYFIITWIGFFIGALISLISWVKATREYKSISDYEQWLKSWFGGDS